MTRKGLIEYWIKTSDKDFSTMENLFKTKDYHWALFVGHLVVEKLLKAYYVKMISAESPFTHDLLQIADKAHLTLSEKQKDLLDLVTTFNIRTRYTDYKLEFYKKCTKEYTETNIKKIREFRVWVKKKLAE